MVGFKELPPNMQPTLGTKMISAGFAAMSADLVTFPLDTAKVRLQIQGSGAPAATSTGTAAAATSSKILTSGHLVSSDHRMAPKYSKRREAQIAAKNFKYRGVIGTISTITKEEGARALYNGLVPGLQRQMCFASVRIGLYDSVKDFYCKALSCQSDVSNPPPSMRILAGMTTGALAVISAQPTDVVKVRMQADCPPPGQPRRYAGSNLAYRTIAMEEGVRGLWKGSIPNIARNCIVNACELVTYDYTKTFILRSGMMTDNLPCHSVSAFITGFVTTCVCSPVDVLKTRYMNAGKGTYSGLGDCTVKMYKEGGLTAFWKGFMPNFLRLGAWNICMFVCFEQFKRGFTLMMVEPTETNNPNQNAKAKPRPMT